MSGQAATTSVARPLLRLTLRTTLLLGLLTATFYALPLRAEDQDVGTRVLFVVLLAAGVVLVLRAQVKVARQVDTRPLAAVEAVLSALYLIILVFSALYFALAARDGQFVELGTRTDALYFSVAVMTTVGFGDVHAAGEVSRALVTAHMLFNLFFIGTAVKLLSSRADRAFSRD